MIYLTTGGNGAGKTLFTLKDVRDLQLKTGRPVYHNGRFRLKADFGWQQIEFKDWQKVPDGAIFLIDECHNDLPLRRAGSEVPEHVKMLAEHRVRGFDFFLITQHPANIDVFVRRIIASPGWHRHLKNFKGSPLVSVTEYSQVNTDCEKPGASDEGTVTMKARPKEVFDWYESATLHTVQRRLPKQLFVMLAAFALIPALGYLAYSKFNDSSFMQAAQGAKPIVEGATPSSGSVASSRGSGDVPMTPQDYYASFQPRLSDLPHTAPRYDSVTAPTVAPFPAACVMSATRCACYTQQATRMPMDDALCRQIAQSGYFMDWQGQPQGQPTGQPSPSPSPRPLL